MQMLCGKVCFNLANHMLGLFYVGLCIKYCSHCWNFTDCMHRRPNSDSPGAHQLPVFSIIIYERIDKKVLKYSIQYDVQKYSFHALLHRFDCSFFLHRGMASVPHSCWMQYKRFRTTFMEQCYRPTTVSLCCHNFFAKPASIATADGCIKVFTKNIPKT